MSPLSSRHASGTQIVSGWCWVCFLLDVALASYFYLTVALAPDLELTSVWLYALFRHYYFGRCGLFILASLHVAYRCGGSDLGKRTSCKAPLIAPPRLTQHPSCLTQRPPCLSQRPPRLS